MLNLTDRIPSGTRASPSSEVSSKAETALCLSLRLSELRNGADVLRLLRGFLNIVCYKWSWPNLEIGQAHHEVEFYVIRLRQLHRDHVIVLLID